MSILTDALIRGERFLAKDCCQSYGITHVHHFYIKRQLSTYSRLWAAAQLAKEFRLRRSLMFFIQSNGLGFTVMNRYQPTQHGKAVGGSQVNRYFTGTLYIPSMVAGSHSPLCVRSQIKAADEGICYVVLAIRGSVRRIHPKCDHAEQCP